MYSSCPEITNVMKCCDHPGVYPAAVRLHLYLSKTHTKHLSALWDPERSRSPQSPIFLLLPTKNVRYAHIHSIQKCRKPSCKYWSHALWGQASAGHWLIRRSELSSYPQAGQQQTGEEVTMSESCLCWHCPLKTSKQQQVKTRSDIYSPTWAHKEAAHLSTVLCLYVNGLRFRDALCFYFHSPLLVTLELKNVFTFTNTFFT